MTRSAGAAKPAVSPRRNLVTAAGLLLLGLIVYANALDNPFIIDDVEVIVNDFRVHDLRLGELLTGPYWPPGYHDFLYRPLVKISFALNWAVSREAWTFRLPNLLFHVGAGFLVYLLTRDLARSFHAGATAAAVFVIHPIHTEVLNTIVGRTDVLAAFFGLLAVWLYQRNSVDATKRAGLGSILAFIAFAAALLCKESSVTLVGVMLILDVARSRGAGPRTMRFWWARRLASCYVPMLVAVGGYAAARHEVLGGNVKDPEKISLVDNVIAHPEHGLAPGDSAWLARWGTPVATFGLAARLMVWPHPLSWDYSYAAIDTVKRGSDPRFLFGLLALAIILAGLKITFRRIPAAFIGLALGPVTYSVTSNVFVLIGTVFAERLLYLPSVGYCMLVGLVGAWAIDHRGRSHLPGGTIAANQAHSGPGRQAGPTGRLVALAAGVALCGAYAWLTVARNRDWDSRQALDAADVKTNPRSCRLLSQNGNNALERGEPVVAFDFAQKALAIHPEYAGAWRVSGMARNQQGDLNAALLDLKRSFELGGADDENANVVVTEAFASHGDYVQAIGLLRRLVAIKPLAATAQNNLAWYLITAEPPELRDPQAAVVHAAQAVRLRPHEPEFLDTYVSALVAAGRRDEAVRALREGLPRMPESPRRADLAKRLSELEQSE